jgi:hypothetical protein
MSMRGDRRKRREAITAGSAAIAAVLADVACPRCPAVLQGRAAYTIHADAGCEHPEAFGQLVRLPDGRYGQRYRHPELR